MILAIRAFGDPILRQTTQAIGPDYPELKQLIANMYETMYESNGVGLAAPQIGKNIRLFIIDTNAFSDKKIKGVKQTFINPQLISESGNLWDFEEGCLSIPKIRENIKRHSNLLLKYQDENFEWQEMACDDMVARVIQHEYDHLEGVLFVDLLSPLKKQLIKGKLINISKGKIDVDYKMKFYLKK